VLNETVELAFRWRLLGYITLDAAGKPTFPRASSAPGVYRIEFDADKASVYFGEATNLDERLGRYHSPGRQQPTNVRINGILCSTLAARGRCHLSIAEILSFQTDRREAALDLRLKAARVLVESAGIVRARIDGSRTVLNLDPTFDRTFGSH
jgi:hypothetical protein